MQPGRRDVNTPAICLPKGPCGRRPKVCISMLHSRVDNVPQSVWTQAESLRCGHPSIKRSNERIHFMQSSEHKAVLYPT